MENRISCVWQTGRATFRCMSRHGSSTRIAKTHWTNYTILSDGWVSLKCLALTRSQIRINSESSEDLFHEVLSRKLQRRNLLYEIWTRSVSTFKSANFMNFCSKNYFSYNAYTNIFFLLSPVKLNLKMLWQHFAIVFW